MKLRILSAALIVVALVCQTYAQCTTGCSTTYTLGSSSQTLSFTVGSSNQTICIVKSGAVSGNATITSGTFDISNRPNTILCFGPGVVVASGVSITNPNNQFSIHNYGALQNSLTLTQTQQVINNYGTISGPVSISGSSTINNMSGGTFSASSFTFQGNFVNNTGSSFNLPTAFSADNGANFSGAGTFAVTGNFSTNNGSNVNVGGAASITGTISTGTPVAFGSTLTVGGSLNSNNGGAITITGNTTVGGNVSTSASGITFGGSLGVTGSFSSGNGGPVSVAGPVTIGGTLTTGATTTFSSTLSVTGAATINNGGPLTVTGATTIGGGITTTATTNFGSSLAVTGNITVNNGGPLTVTGNTSATGALNTTAATNLGGTLTLGGNATINNGGPLTVTGATTIGGFLNTTANTSFGSTLGVTGNVIANNGGPISVTSNLSVGGYMSVSTTVNIGGATTISNTGYNNPALNVPNGGTLTVTSGGNVTGNYSGGGTTNFNGTLNFTGTINNPNGGTITSGSGSCKTLCASSITNGGTISSTSGPNMNVCATPSGGTQTNVTVNINPTAAPSGLGTSVSGATITGTFTAASPAPGGYMVLRKTSAFNSGDMPVGNTTYSVGSTIGGATVAAFIAGSATSFSHANGCGTFYYAVVSSSNNSGTCGTFYTTSYASSGPVAISCNGPRYWVSNSTSNWNSTANWSYSSGGAGGASVPTSVNLAIFDNVRNGNCTIDATVDVLGIQVSGYTGIISQNGNPITMGASGYSQTSGTFTGGSSAIAINNNGLFSLSGGTFTSTSGSATLTGSFNSNQTLFNHSAGTFAHNNGTWVINPSLAGCANPTLTLDVIPATTFYNLTLNGVAGCGINANFSTGTGDVVNVSNTLNHNDGVISGQFSAKGSLTVGTGADAGYGTITVDGTGTQTYTGSTGRTCLLVVNKSSGAFTPLGATDLYVQGFTLSAGSFTAPSGTLNVGGNWASNVTIFGHSAGTFTHNNGTVEFNPTLISCANPTLTVDIIPATTFYNFTVNGIAGCGINATLTTGTGDVVACTNNFTHTDGIISGAFSFQGNLSIGAGADGGTGTLTANGTGAQTFYQAAGSPRTCQLIVNKSASALTPAVGATDLTLQGFQLTAGSFTAPSGTLNVGGPWSTSLTIFGHSGGTYTHNNGTVEFNPTLISCANPTFTMDVIPTTLLYNFTVNGIAGCGINATLSTASGDVVPCANNFTHTDGIIAGAFSFQNNLILNAGADGGTGTITANGTGAQTYAQAVGSPRTCQIIVNKASGALTPAVGTTDLVTQGFQLTAGSFTAPTGTLNLGGPWATNVTIFGHSAGTYTHNNGTVEFNPNLISCANPTFTVDVIPSTLLYNFVVNGNAGCGINATISTASGDVVQAINDFTHIDGIIAGSFAFQRNLIINAGADGGTGTITANGTGSQTFYQASGSPRTCQLIVTKSSGALTPAVGATDLWTQGFQLTAGNFTAPSGTLNVGGPWATSLTIFGHSGGTFTHNNGTVEFNPNLISCANPTFTVDVIPSTLLYNFVVNGQAGCGINATVSTASGDVVQGAGDFIHTDGIIAGNFAFYGNLTINLGADGGTGIITANGTGAQTYYQAVGTPRTCQLYVNKSAGAFTPGVGATDLRTQGFQLIAGAFTAPSGTLNVGGPWASSLTIFGHLGGTFTHNNGTVEFNPNLISCANPTFTVDVIPATLLYNFVVNGNAGCGINATVSTATGDVVQGAGNFTHTDGIIAGNFAFYGNLVINAGADGGTGTITANGTGAQTYYQAVGTPRTCQLIVTKSAGTLTPAVGTTDLLVQGFSLTSGSFTAPTGSLNVGGNWASSLTIFGHTGGTFIHNNGTVEFNPSLISCANPTFTFDVINGTQLYNFRVNGQAGCGINATMTTAAGDTLDVLNALTYNDGICNGMIEAGGNVTVAATFDGGTGRLIFKGSNAQNFDLTGASALFDGPVVMNKTSNTVTLLSACQLDAVGQTITWNNGIMNTTSTNLLIIGLPVTSGFGNTNSFANGPVRKIGNTSFTFPIGKGTKFGQVFMTTPSLTTDQFTAEYFGTNPNGTWNVSTKEATVTSVSTCEYWLVDRTVGTSNVGIRLSWDNSRSCAVTNINEQRVGQWNGSQWINQGSNGSPTGNTTAGTVQSCGTIGTFGASNPFTNITSTVTTISYAGSPFCTSLTSPQAVTFAGISGGTFTSSPAGLTINASTGAITPSTSAAGTYTISYSVTSSTSCVNPLATTSVTITTLPTASISYTTAPWCSSNGTVQNVTRTGTAGGTYSASPAGLSMVAGTGAITPSGSTPNTYTVTYTIAASGGCAAVTPTTSVTVTPVNSATISYTGSPFCTNAGMQNVTQTGTTGGTYTATAGLTINNSTGQIDPSTSTAGAKTITYSMAATGGCAAATATTSVSISTAPSSSISYAGPFCTSNATGQNPTRTGTAGGTYSSTTGLSITSAGVITPSTSTPGTYTVTYTIAAAAGCAAYSTTASVTITAANSAAISYTGSPFCTTAGVQSVTQTGTSGGTYTASAGLTINNTNGQIDPSTSTAGAKTITYTMAATGGCALATATASVTITTAPSATISYAGTPFCRSVGTAQAVTRTGTAGGTYSASPTGLSLNATTGDITPSGSTAGTYTVTYAFAAAGGCAAFTTTTSVTITTAPSATISYSGTSLCLLTLTNQNVSQTGTSGGTYSAAPSGLSINASTGAITPSTSSANTYTVTYTIAANAGCPLYTTTATAAVYANPTVAAITGPQTNCVGSNTTFSNATAGGAWTTSNSAIATVNSGGVVTGIAAGTTNINYTVTGSGGCQTMVSRSVTVYPSAPGTPGTFGNGYWIGYVYNASDYASNYSGYYTTASPLSYNSGTDFGTNSSPSTAATYQGCQVNQSGYSIRYQRTNFTPGTYQIDVNGNDDGMDIILDGVTIYTFGGYSNSTRTNVWTGTLNATSQVEIRYNNSGGGSGYINFTFTSVTNTPPTAGTIAGNQVACATATPAFQLTSSVAAVQGTCSLKSPSYQWESSIDNVTFAAISGATAAAYTIPSPLSQTTYFRRSYRTWCETVYSNTVTVTIYAGPQGTPNTFGNGLWNAYVYNASDYSTNYSGYYTTASSLSYNTTTDFGTLSAPSTAATYQGCQVSQNGYSVRYQRTNFTPGTYQIDIPQNDDGMDIILNGTTVYSSGGNNNTLRTNVWTGTLNATSQLELRFNNSGGNTGYLSWTITSVTNSPVPTPGSISGNQIACNTATPTFQLANVTAATAGTCTNIAPVYQWQSSTDNVTFTNISGANATSYTIPSPLSQTTYFRRSYRTWCETVYSNTVTVTIYNGAQGTPGTFGNGVWNAYVYSASDYSTGYSGYYTTPSPYSYATSTDFGNLAAPSTAPNYQGCQVSQNGYSVRYQRTNFTPGTYQIDIPYNDDGMDIILNGTTVYSSGGNNNTLRTNVWTGTLNATSQLEIRYNNSGGSTGYVAFNFTSVTNTPPTPGVIAGNQTSCNTATPLFQLTSTSAATQGTCSLLATPYQWESSTDNVTYATISGANATTYTIPGPLSQTTYYRRAYRTWCETVYTNVVTVTVYNGAQGTPGVYGNGLWNAYVYNSMDFSTNYSGYYTTASSLNYHSTTDFGTTSRPSTAPTYQGCHVGNTQYSIRYQRTGFVWGQYQIDIPYNDDDMQIILDGNVVYNHAYFDANPRTNVWTGTLGPNSQLEIRYLNNSGPGEIWWNFTKLISVTASSPGTISGNQAVCTGSTPVVTLASVTTATQGTCTQNQNTTASANLPYQWQSSTDNVTFAGISGANATSYTIPSALGQTTYFRRVYRTYCDTTYSNTITVTVYSGAVGTPNTFGNGTWNAYVYNATDYTSSYSGYYTTTAALTYNSTTDYAAGIAPSLASNYQGCQVNANAYSVRYQRTNFPLGVYRIGVDRNDDNMAIILNGITVYSSGTNTGVRTNVWTGTLGANSQLEIRYNNVTGPGDISWNFTPVTNTPSTPGTIAGNQAVCTGNAPAATFTSTSAATQGTCTLVPSPYQWQLSTDNVIFNNISGANSTTLAYATALTQTTYFRRSYRTYCDTLYSNVITVTVYNGAVGTPNTFGNGTWNAFVYNAQDYTSGYSGYYTTGSALTYNSTTDFVNSIAPSMASNYQGCQVSATSHSVRYQRTGFPLGVYRIGFDINDDGADIILNGVTVYTSGGYNNGVRTNVWTGTLGANSQLEIRYRNTGGIGEISWNFTVVANSPATSAGTIGSNQSVCSTTTPAQLTNTTSGSVGTCTIVVSNPYQWQSSTDNVTFANIAGANSSTYTFPGALSQTTYYRRLYRSYCDTVATSAITITVTSLPTASISYSGTPFCTSLSSPQSVTQSGNTGGTYTSTAGLSINASTGAITPSTSTAGTYTVTYTIAAAGGCGTITANTSVTITAPPTITYAGSPYCTSVSGGQAVTRTGVSGGSYTSTTGLTLNGSNGNVTPSSSTAGTYTVTYSYSASGGCAAGTTTTSVTITAPPTISYAGPFCTSVSTPQAVTRTGVSGGTYSSTGGLTISSSTGAITPSSSTAGTYTVTYTFGASGGCSAGTTTTSVTITAPPTISYAGPFCTSVSAGQSVTRTGISGGTYSSTSGLTISSTTGAITPSTSTPGTYTVTYTFGASGGCAAGTTTTSVTITALPTASISYSGTPFCQTVSTPQSVSLTGTSGGTYSSTIGLSINSSTGAVTPSTSTAGSYTVTYTIAAAGGCAAVVATAPVTITTLPTASISYSGSPWCLSAGGSKAVSLTGTSGGTYSSTTGLSINSSSGAINVASSSVGTYTVTYTINASGGCSAVSATTSVSINADVTTPTTPSGSLTFCQGSSPVAYTTSASNATGYSWSVTGTGNSMSGTGTTGTATWDAAFSGTATISVSSLGCGGPKGPVTLSVSVNPSGMWLGTTNNWNTASNWCGGVPTSTTDVVIPTGAVNMPQVNANSFANNITIQSGASLTVNGSNNLTIAGTVSNSGTFTPGLSSTVTYSSAGSQSVIPTNYNNLVTSGGTKVFTGTIGIAGTFTPGAATHTCTGSTIDFNGSSAQNIPAFSFYNMTTSGNSTKTLTGDVTVNGQLALSNGTLSLGSQIFTLGGTISAAGSGNLAATCASEIVVAGTGAAGALRFATGQNTLGRLTLTRSSAGTVALGTDVNICNQLDLSIGKVVIGAYNLTLLSGAVSTNQNDNSYVQTLDQMSPTGAGFFIREMTSGGGELIAPVGTTTYTPAHINNIGTTRNFKVRVFNGVYEHGISGSAITNIDASVNKTWEIEPLAGAGTPNVSIRLQWGDADENMDFPTVRQNNRAYMGKNEGGNGDLWIPQNIYGRQFAMAPYSIMTSGVTTFSKFAIGSEEEPLPVVMGDLSLEQLPKANRLSWKSYSERGALYYEVYRSANGLAFETVGRLPAKGTAASYHFDDPSTSAKTLYYKVKFVGEARGDEHWTNVVVVKAGYQTAYNFYPNPVHTQLTLSNENLADGDQMTVVITDLKGALQSTLHATVSGGKAEIRVADLPTGVYMVEGFCKGESTGKRKITKM